MFISLLVLRLFICSQQPKSKREIIGEQAANLYHRNFTSPGYSGGCAFWATEVSLCSAFVVAYTRGNLAMSCRFYRSLILRTGRGAPTRWLGSIPNAEKVPMTGYSVFKLQHLISEMLRKLLPANSFDGMSLTLQRTFFCDLYGITQKIFLLFS